MDGGTEQVVGGRAQRTRSELSCNVDLKTYEGITELQVAEGRGHAAVATLIRNKKQETLLLGRRVVINRLVSKPELNGRRHGRELRR